ncbi:MFS transporter [Olivibacter domesticus]|uniref:Multidrug resistance protein n=1 Tax=Olivibacter domesticus TaxID=407022 RepID=A0A1H7QZ42_OLID1|nr:MFS transporter [Olivibacter domesticus]SEL53172.1 Multidrug resistance protein [Olivibacter domesticus]
MKLYNSKYEKISTLSTFILIPLSGLVTDIYIPSFPDMQSTFNTSAAGIQLTLSCFLISYGITMFVAGSLVDSYGRYNIVLGALLLFALSNFLIASVHNLLFLYAMRVLQGVLTAFIVVAKRAFLVDIYTGDKLKHYMGLLSVVWSLGPITAPFLGGYLQSYWGWTSNFYFVGFYALFSFSLEWIFCGEAMRGVHSFRIPIIIKNYRKVLGTSDFSLGLFVLGTSYAMVLIFGMTAPFIIEEHFHFSSIVTGYCALISGLGLFVGGMLAKFLTKKPLLAKLRFGNLAQCFLALLMFIVGNFFSSIYVLMLFVFAMHICAGFIYNVYFTFCLTRFPENAGISSGITSGGAYLITSVLSYGTVNLLNVNNQSTLAICYFIMAALTFSLLLILRKISIV